MRGLYVAVSHPSTRVETHLTSETHQEDLTILGSATRSEAVGGRWRRPGQQERISWMTLATTATPDQVADPGKAGAVKGGRANLLAPGALTAPG